MVLKELQINFNEKKIYLFIVLKELQINFNEKFRIFIFFIKKRIWGSFRTIVIVLLDVIQRLTCFSRIIQQHH